MDACSVYNWLMKVIRELELDPETDQERSAVEHFRWALGGTAQHLRRFLDLRGSRDVPEEV